MQKHNHVHKQTKQKLFEIFQNRKVMFENDEYYREVDENTFETKKLQETINKNKPIDNETKNINENKNSDNDEYVAPKNNHSLKKIFAANKNSSNDEYVAPKNNHSLTKIFAANKTDNASIIYNAQIKKEKKPVTTQHDNSNNSNNVDVNDNNDDDDDDDEFIDYDDKHTKEHIIKPKHKLWCNNCYIAGHVEQYCTVGIVCKLCGEQGHEKKQCPRNRCKKCLKLGHSAESCN